MSKYGVIGNVELEAVTYADSTITITPDKVDSDDDDSDAWIYILIGGAVLASIIVFAVLFTCIRRRNKRREEAAIAY